MILIIVIILMIMINCSKKRDLPISYKYKEILFCKAGPMKDNGLWPMLVLWNECLCYG